MAMIPAMIPGLVGGGTAVSNPIAPVGLQPIEIDRPNIIEPGLAGAVGALETGGAGVVGTAFEPVPEEALSLPSKNFGGLSDTAVTNLNESFINMFDPPLYDSYAHEAGNFSSSALGSGLFVLSLSYLKSIDVDKKKKKKI